MKPNNGTNNSYIHENDYIVSCVCTISIIYKDGEVGRSFLAISCLDICISLYRNPHSKIPTVFMSL